MTSDKMATSSDGLTLVVHDLDDGGLNGDRPPALLVHATSFHGRVLGPLATVLSPHWHCYANDVRGHGSSHAPADADLSWDVLTDDILRILEVLDLRQAPLGFGHSSGASALLLAEARHPGSFSSLYCYEPIVVNDELRASGPGPPDPERARNRRSQFPHQADALAQYQERAAFSQFDPRVLRAYVDYGLVRSANGVELACSPEFEARFYEEGYAADVLSETDRIGCPVTIAVGEKSLDLGRACVAVVQKLVPQARLVELAGLDHLGPLENPGLVASSIITENETPTA